MAKGIEKTFGNEAADFFLKLKPDFKLPRHFEFLLPYETSEVKKVTKQFFDKFYSDNRNRIYILGINPGRFGSGTTGISFTDPVRLASDCGIENTFVRKPELSSDFIYRMIHKYGGVNKFYSDFFLTAICPLGFIKDGKNINYYDDKALISSSRRFITKTLKRQMKFGAFSHTAICLGEGKNFTCLSELNNELKLFNEIVPLAHPRFIMQYKRKKLDEYIDSYIRTLEKAVKKNRRLT